jgi:hypothetical protein
MFGAVSRSESLQLRVEVERGISPISGLVALERGPERPFAGWTELFAALEAAVADDQEKEKTDAENL